MASTRPVDKKECLKWYNRHIAPLLNVEEAALQMIAQRLCYMWLAPHFPIDLYIDVNLDGRSVGAYSRRNTLSAVQIGKVWGCAAHLLTPVDLSDKGASVIFFTGTNAAPDRDVLARYFRSNGIYEDAEAKLGKSAYDEVSDTLLRWVRQALRADRPVTIVGHSLGGALATRLMANLTTSEQKHVRLVTFCPAGIEKETAQRVLPERTRMIWHEADPVVLLSGHHPSGHGYEITNAIHNTSAVIAETHSRPFLVEWELLGKPVNLREVKRPADILAQVGRPGRLVLGSVLRPILQALNWVG